MENFYFSGCIQAKLDDKNRFVLPQGMRYGLVEKGELSFALGLGIGGCLSIYRESDLDRMIKAFSPSAYRIRYQKFFTLFFSTLHKTTCDKLGRVLIPNVLKNAAGLSGEIIIAGVLNRIEIWPKEKYEKQLADLFSADMGDSELQKISEEAFSLLDPKTHETLEQEYEREFSTPTRSTSGSSEPLS